MKLFMTRLLAIGLLICCIAPAANAASATANLAITVTSAGGGGSLPAGVTLAPMDGETMTGNTMSHNYYARNGFTNAASSVFNSAYNNGGWDDPRFFPVIDDYSFYPANSTTTFKTLGLNTARVAGRSTIDGRSPIGGVLRHMRRHIVLAQIGDKLGHIVGLVGTGVIR
jgi:hypothetical protein